MRMCSSRAIQRDAARSQGVKRGSCIGSERAPAVPAAVLTAARKPLGAVVSRSIANVQLTRTMPGAPDGYYVILQFKTAFAHKEEALETVIPMMDKDGKWRVSGYFIK